MSSDLAYLKDLWTEIHALRNRIGHLERIDVAPDSLALRDGVAAPTAAAGMAILYVDTGTGDFMIRFGDNVTKVLATDT